MAFVGVVADPVAVVGWGEDKKLKLETDDGAAALFPDLFASFPPSKSANGSAGFAGAGFAGASIMDSRRSSMPEAGGAAGAAGHPGLQRRGFVRQVEGFPVFTTQHSVPRHLPGS